jgi:hypothetical protein
MLKINRENGWIKIKRFLTRAILLIVFVVIIGLLMFGIQVALLSRV